MKKAITDSASFRLINSSTLEITYFDDITVECEDVLENISAIKQLTGDQEMKFIVVVNEFTQFTLESKKLIIEENAKGSEKIIAEAIVANSLANRLFENYYMNKNKSLYPIKIFPSYIEAKQWIENLDPESEK